jgi:type I site-specific restriction endonuclease
LLSLRAPGKLLKFMRQNRRPLEETSINSSIVDRSYQHEAIRRLAEAFAANKRRALLVMATGTGKTRVRGRLCIKRRECWRSSIFVGAGKRG